MQKIVKSNSNSPAKLNPPNSNSNSKNINEKPNRIFVGGIPFNISETELGSYFSKFGKVTEVKLERHKKTAKLKGFAFVTFKTQTGVQKACETKNHFYKGRKMGVRAAKQSGEATQLTKKLQELKIFASGFPLDTQEREIYHLFGSFGEVDRVMMQNHSKTREFRGFAYIVMKNKIEMSQILNLKILRFRRGKYEIEVRSAKSKGQIYKDRISDGSQNSKNSGRKLMDQLESPLLPQTPRRDPIANEIVPVQIQPFRAGPTPNFGASVQRRNHTPRINVAVDDGTGVSSQSLAEMRIGDHNLLWRPRRRLSNPFQRSRDQPRPDHGFTQYQLPGSNPFTLTRTYEIEKEEELTYFGRVQVEERRQQGFQPNLVVSQKIVTEFRYKGQKQDYKSLIEERVHIGNTGEAYREPRTGPWNWEA